MTELVFCHPFLLWIPIAYQPLAGMSLFYSFFVFLMPSMYLISFLLHPFHEFSLASSLWQALKLTLKKVDNLKNISACITSFISQNTMDRQVDFCVSYRWEHGLKWVTFNAQSHRTRKSCKWSCVLGFKSCHCPALQPFCLKAGVGPLFTPAHHATSSVHRNSWSYATETSGVQSEAHSIIERTLLVSHI